VLLGFTNAQEHRTARSVVYLFVTPTGRG
jgi:mannosyltransferase